MKILLILVMSLASSAYAKFHSFSGDDLKEYQVREFVLNTDRSVDLYKEYDFSCKKGKTVYLVELVKDQKTITLKAGCSKNKVFNSFVADVLFTVIDSPNVIECKLSSDCYMDVSGSEQCRYSFGSQTKTEYLYISVDQNNFVSSYSNRFKVTKCR